MLKPADAYGLRFMVPANDQAVGACLSTAGEFARVELEFILAACDGDLMDVGANIGAICLPFAKRRPDARVVAIEAHPEIAAILSSNVAENGLAGVDVINAVAGETSGLVDIPVAPIDGRENVGATSLYEKGHPTRRARMVRLDDVASTATAFVKVDVEGFEDRVLAGATRLLSDVRPAWLVEVSRRRPITAAKVKDALAGAGYRLFWFFSPFTTPAAGGDKRRIVGDMALLACDGQPPWVMKEALGEWPGDVRDFPYLERFGFEPS